MRHKSIIRTAIAAVLAVLLLGLPFRPTVCFASSGEEELESVTFYPWISSCEPVFFDGASSSSALWNHYAAENVLDGDLNTSWQEAGAGYGVGETITLRLDFPKVIGVLSLRAGYVPYYEANGRPETMRVTVSGGKTFVIRLQDENAEQFIELPEEIETDFLELEILSAYPGSAHTDTCITEICAWRSDPRFGMTNGPAADRIPADVQGTLGSCRWELTPRGDLIIYGGQFESTADSAEDWPWYEYRALIKTVQLPERVSARGSLCAMFYNTGIEEADLRNLETENVTDLSYLFCGCGSLRRVDLTHFRTDRVRDMRWMFGSCYESSAGSVVNRLESLDLGSFDTGAVRSMKGLFSGCRDLSALDLSGFDTGSVRDMGEVFGEIRGGDTGCQRLETLDLTSFDTSKAESMAGMFWNCSSLRSVDLSSFDPSRVTTMSVMFRGCRSLRALDLSGFHTGSLRDMGAMFSGCASLTELSLEAFDTRRLETITFNETGGPVSEGLFTGCSSLETVRWGNFRTDQVSCFDGFFSGCTSLKALDLSGLNTQNALSVQSMFYGCSSLTELDLRSLDLGRAEAFSYLFSGCSGLQRLVMGEEIGDLHNSVCIFDGCDALMESGDFTGPEALKQILANTPAGGPWY